MNEHGWWKWWLDMSTAESSARWISNAQFIPILTFPSGQFLCQLLQKGRDYPTGEKFSSEFKFRYRLIL